jgi:cellulose synthase/poly-beta-1,6-N-acetylglucosamine synthase-like glycosyltransferase
MTAPCGPVAVVIACHTLDRWTSIVAAIESAQQQRLATTSVIVAVDHNEALVARLRREIHGIDVVHNDSDTRGASATRNAGAAIATTSIIAFLDDDETATPSWIRRLTEPFGSDDVVGTGGQYRPNWLTAKPSWFPDEFGWAVGGSFTGMPTVASRVRNVWAGNMAVRASDFRAVSGFRSDFGKLARRSRPEDTDLCIRMAAATGGHWVYVPDAIIDHEVPASRATFGFFLRRSFAEGRGKVELKQHLGNAGSFGDESKFLRATIPRGIARHILAGGPGAMRAVAIVAGVAAAGAGAAAALARPAVAGASA